MYACTSLMTTVQNKSREKERLYSVDILDGLVCRYFISLRAPFMLILVDRMVCTYAAYLANDSKR